MRQIQVVLKVSDALLTAADRVPLEAALGEMAFNQALAVRERARVHAARVVSIDTLDDWADRLQGAQNTLSKLGAPHTAVALQDLRKEITNAGETFKEVPYA